MKSFFKRTIVVFCLFITHAVAAQTRYTNEFRDISGSGIGVRVWKTANTNYDLSLLLDLKGEVVSNAWAIKALRVVEAFDNTGNDITTNAVPYKSRYWWSPSYTPGLLHDGMRTSLSFRGLSKSVKKIKRVVLNIDLNYLSETNYSWVVISNLLDKCDSDFTNSVLSGFGINVAWFDQKSYVTKSNEVAKLLAEGGHYQRGTLNDIFATEFRASFSGAFHSSDRTIRLIIQDPQRKLCGFSFRDGKHPYYDGGCGNATGVAKNMDDMAIQCWVYYFEQVPANDWQIEFYLDSPLATVTRTIVLENIGVR